ncbi:MAG TPA: VWA domain-containing protein, partial [Acidimicrobiia bacterium]|nr:VWA domain-containing protein [Acidimicrobiia bacterium]
RTTRRSARREPVPELAVAPNAEDAARPAVAFARVLRALGLDVSVGSTVTYAEALAAAGIGRRASVYWAGRATLVHRPEDVPIYDRAFAAFWEGTATATEPAPPEFPLGLAADAPGGPGGDDAPGGPVQAVRWSPAEVLRTRDFASYSNAEFEEARRVMRDLRLAGALRRSRRRRPVRRSRRRHAHPDLRRAVRRSLRAGGEPIERPALVPTERPRRVVLLCDVSGSMEPYARSILRFLHAAVAGRARVEAFALGTRLTRITRELSSRDPDAALTAAAERVPDWSGGTRLGTGMREFNDRWGVRGMARGAVVVIVSDGWDRGDPAVLGEQMARLARVAHRVVWVNPLKASPGFAPLAGGMAAALPHVDEFVEGHSLESLEHLAQVIAR